MRLPSPSSTTSTSTFCFSSPRTSPAWPSSPDSALQTPPRQTPEALPPSSEHDRIFAFSPSLAEEIAQHRAQRSARSSFGAWDAARPRLQTAQRLGASLQALLEVPRTASRRAPQPPLLASAFSPDTDTASSLDLSSDDASSDSSHKAEPCLAEWITRVHPTLHRAPPRAQHPRRHAWPPSPQRAERPGDAQPDSSPCAQLTKRRRQG